jgi:hypothetical protein
MSGRIASRSAMRRSTAASAAWRIAANCACGIMAGFLEA